MLLAQQIAQANLSPSAQRIFKRCLLAIASADGAPNVNERQFIARMFPILSASSAADLNSTELETFTAEYGQEEDTDVDGPTDPAAGLGQFGLGAAETQAQVDVPEGLSQLYSHSELLLTTSICLSLLNGRYCSQKSRVVSKVAQQLGVSTRRLRALEEQALQNILDRGRRIPGQEPALPPKDGSKLRELPQRIEAPFPEVLSQLWSSDAELISDLRERKKDSKA